MKVAGLWLTACWKRAPIRIRESNFKRRIWIGVGLGCWVWLAGCSSLVLSPMPAAMSRQGLSDDAVTHTNAEAPKRKLDPDADAQSAGARAEAVDGGPFDDEPFDDVLKSPDWRSRTLWPDPLEGPAAVRAVRDLSVPRWQHAGWLDGRPSDETKTNEATEQKPDDRPRHESITTEQWHAIARSVNAEQLSGWNAAILATWSEDATAAMPITTQEHEALLYELTVTPLQYDRKSGRRFDAGEPTQAEDEGADNDDPSGQAQASAHPGTRWLDSLERIASFTIGTSKKEEIDDQPLPDDTDATDVPDERHEEKETAAVAQLEPPGTVPESLRAAAAEAYCYSMSQKNGSAEQVFQQAGLALQRDDLPVLVRAELIRGIARQIPPRKIPRIEAALLDEPLNSNSSQPTQLQLAVLDACLIYTLSHPLTTKVAASGSHAADRSQVALDADQLDPLGLWPQKIWQSRWDDSPEVVNRFGLWLALTQHPLAEGYLKQCLQHVSSSVQWQAIRSLGLLDREQVRAELLEKAEQFTGTPRAIALLAAAEDEPQRIFAYADDPSDAVRTMVAQFALRSANPAAVQTLLQLIEDEDPQIPQTVLKQCGHWTDADVFPILSAAYRSPAATIHNQARQRLEQRFGLMIASLGTEASEREQFLRQIADRHGLKMNPLSITEPVVDGAQRGRQSSGMVNSATVTEQQRQDLQKLIARVSDLNVDKFVRRRHEQDLRTLATNFPEVIDDDLETLEGVALQERVALYAGLKIAGLSTFQELQSDDLFTRRTAAWAIAQQAEKQTLAEWKFRLLAVQLKGEQDIHVCRGIMQAIAADTTPAARSVAEAALLHVWPDVRILGCHYAARQRLPQLAPFLLPLLVERNSTVQQAAVRAAGLCRNPLVIDGFATDRQSAGGNAHSQDGLRALLGTVPIELEREVITSLVRLGDQQGWQELRKLSYSKNSETRMAAIRLMGQMGNTGVIGHLIQLGWTESHPGVQMAILDSLQQLIPVSARPEFGPAMTPKQKLQAWSEWQESQSKRP